MGGELAKFWLCAEECGFCLRQFRSAACLPGSDRRAKNQGQPTCAPQAGLSQGGLKRLSENLYPRGMVFHIRNGTPYSEQPAAKHLKPAVASWGSLAQLAHATPQLTRTLLQHAGGTPQRDAAPIGATEMSTRTLVSPV